MDRETSGNDKAGTAQPDLARRRLLIALAIGAAVPWGTVATAENAPPEATPLHYASLLDVARRIEAGDLSPTVLAEMQLERIATIDPGLHSYVTGAIQEAIQDTHKFLLLSKGGCPEFC